MKVLMISGDKNILVEGSEAYGRFTLQKASVDRLDVFVWPQIHSTREIYFVAKENSYDVITAQDPFWRGLLAWFISCRTGTKLNLQVHTDLSSQSFFRRSLAYFLLRKADSIRVVSEKIKDFLKPLSLKANMSVLPIFIDLDPFRAFQHQQHKRFKKTILWIGRFEPEKDPLLAFPILSRVRDSGIDAGLIMLGSGSLEKKLRTRSEHLASYVEFPGWQNPVSYLQMADVVVSTSKHESYGASIIEALAAGVPVVAPDIGVAREAGAIVAERKDLAETVCDVLRLGKQGELLISIPSREEWVKKWKETLT